ncbi:MAG: hypothetical protein NTU47_05825 [Ignavibacteriales bacterium]|nr:hypothetical protein [Ignavibacteriales bacterium]
MIPLEIETYPLRRFKTRVAWLAVLIIVLIILGLLSHKTISDNLPVWKSSPYGNPANTGTVKAGH